MPSAERVSPQNRLVFIDYARAIAVLLVVGFHILIESMGGLPALETKLTMLDGSARHFFLAALPFSYGCMGVPIFFVISGFCIHLNYERMKAKGFKVFFVRRFFRIYPPYFIALCFFAFVFPSTRLTMDSLLNVSQVVSHVLMVHNLDPRSFFGINGTFWTLGVEMQLYLIYPLLLWIVRRFGWTRALWVTALVEFSLRALSDVISVPYAIGGSPFYYWFSWSIGAKLADDFIKERRPALGRWPLWIFPATAVLIYSMKAHMAFLFPSVALATAVMIARFLASNRDLPETGRCNHALREIGVISYSIYLLHGPPFGYIKHLLSTAFPGTVFSPLETAICLLLSCVPLFFLCWLFYRWVELPSAALGKRIVKKLAARQSEPAPGFQPIP